MTETVLDVFIACPTDAIAARDAIDQALNDWNSRQRAIENIRLRALNYQREGVPILGRGDGQSVTNSQLVDRADIVVGIFYHRLGTATRRALSGTAEEIERAYKANKPVHVYFTSQDPPPRYDRREFSALNDFRKHLESLGLVATFRSLDSLRSKVTMAIDHDVAVLRERGSADSWSQPLKTSTRGLPIAVRYDPRSASIQVKNTGRFPLEDVVVGPSQAGQLPHDAYPVEVFSFDKVRRLKPFDSCQFRLNTKKLRSSRSILVEVSYEQFGDVFRAEYALLLDRF